MKINDFSILIIIVLFTFSISLIISIVNKERSNTLKAKYDSFLTLATNDAMFYINKTLTEKDVNLIADGKAMITGVDKESALDRFFRTLYLNMDYDSYVMGISLKETIEDYVNVFAIIDNDGIWINIKEVEDSYTYNRIWKEKIYFTTYFKDENLIFKFYLDNSFEVFDASSNEQLFYTLDELRVRYKNELFEHDKFEDFMRKTIIDIIKRNLEIYSDKDESFYFSLPYIDDVFYNTIKNKSIIAFLKGVPLIGSEVYNTYAFSGATYGMKKKYIGTTENGKKIYYPKKMNETYNSYSEYVFDSKKEAAINGFSPR